MKLTHDDYMKKLSPARRAKVEARAEELIGEELTLRELRKARELSQETLAELLEMRQGDLSKLERRTDAYLSTIRRYVEAMGGTLDLIVSFPGSKPVKIIQIGEIANESKGVDPKFFYLDEGKRSSKKKHIVAEKVRPDLAGKKHAK